MGASLAAHMANAGLRVLLLDVNKGLADGGLERARKAKPGAFVSPRFETLVRTGSLETDLAEAVRCDVIVEAVLENMEIKRALYTRLDAAGGSVVVMSNTSGLRVQDLLEGRSASFKRRFCVTHYFNPPRYLKLVEIVTGPDTAPETLARAEALCGDVLGKGLVRAKDTPNFIANRLGVFGLMRALELAVEQGYTVEEVDLILGPALGRPKSAVFRTADVVGLDTLVAVARNCHAQLVHDERRAVFTVPRVLEALVARGSLGQKSGEGFYKKAGKDILQLDLQTLQYGPLTKPRFPSIGAAKGLDSAAERIRCMVGGDDRAAQLGRTVTYETLLYAAHRLGEIADDVVSVDRAMRWGFGWDLGPFETWEALGVPSTVEKMQAAGLVVPKSVLKEQRFYPNKPPPSHPRTIELAGLHGQTQEVARNASASLLDLGEGVFCLEYHGKMNALDPDTIALTMQAVARAERDGVGLVIGNDAQSAFSAGANLFSFLVALGQNNMKAIENMIVSFQAACMRTRYARVPVVAAPFGLTLGGGAEVVLGCPHVRAHVELYIGCVEVGVGLIPAGGGCMELAARVSERAPQEAVFDVLSLLKGAFEAIAMAKVSTSAEHARDMGYLRAQDTVSMNRDTLIADAKEIALGLGRAGWRPPPPRRIRVAGEAGAATLTSMLRSLAQAHQISEHDQRIATHLARILTGGAVAAGSVVTEQHILDLEREAFLSLCGEEKTRARIQHMLQKGKPLRN
jgi:3-hydroxyacyl-CoA dehydrogenase